MDVSNDDVGRGWGLKRSVFTRRFAHIREGLNQRDVERVGDLRNPLAQVILEKVLELCGKLDSGWASANNDLVDCQRPGLTARRTCRGTNHVQQAFLLLLRLIPEHGTLDAVHDLLADLLRILNLLQEASVLLDSGNAYQS